MVKIICRAIDCIFWEDGRCSADKITYDPEEGCLTYEVIDDVLDEDEWDDDDLDELVGEEEEDAEYPYDDEDPIEEDPDTDLDMDEDEW